MPRSKGKCGKQVVPSGKREARTPLSDLEENKRMARRNRSCIWHCGRETKNISRICDLCWADREAIYRARKAREAEAGISPAKRVALTKANGARKAKRLEELPTSELSDAQTCKSSSTLSQAVLADNP